MAMVDDESSYVTYPINSNDAKPTASAVSRPKKSDGWGSGSSMQKTSNIFLHSKLPPGTSVARAASEEKNGGGNATSYMAKANATERKKNQQMNGVAGQGKKSKQKQKRNELKNLAFSMG